MRLVEPLVTIVDFNDIMRNIELGGRVCYKSEDKMCPGSDVALVEKLLNFKHESVLEHGVLTCSFITDRGVTHEQVRHRMTSPSQESTRYCAYSKGKFGGEIAVLNPFFFDPEEPCQEVFLPTVTGGGGEVGWYLQPINKPYFMNSFDVWFVTCLWAEWGYLTLMNQFKRSAQEARSVLPNSLKTEIQITANVREWRHILALRTHRDAHPQIRQIMVPLGKALAAKWPVLFGEYKDAEHPAPAVCNKEKLNVRGSNGDCEEAGCSCGGGSDSVVHSGGGPA